MKMIEALILNALLSSTDSQEEKESIDDSIKYILKIGRVRYLIIKYGSIDGEHHKQWLLDQILRVLSDTDTEYQALIEKELGGEWDEGIEP